MGAPSAVQVLRAPGRLAYGCTDLSLAWPHGGTGLGETARLTMQRRFAPYPVTSEAYGGEAVEYLEPGESWAMTCVVRTVDNDAIGLLFGNTSTGTVSQHKVITAPGTVRAGNWMSGRGTVLVFTPDGATGAKSATAPDPDVPFVVFHKAIPTLASEIDIPLERDKEWAIRVVFRAIRNASGPIISMGRRVDITTL